MKLPHLTAATALALALLSPGAQATPTIGFDTGLKSALVGDTFELILQGTGFDTTVDSKTINNLTGGQKLNLQFSAGMLEILNVAIDPRWTFTSGNKTGTLNNATGTLTGMAFGTFPATTDSAFTIAHITFHALQAGDWQLTLSSAEVAGKVNNIAGAKILPAFAPTTVQVTSPVTAIPEPEQWALLVAGLGLLGWRRRRG